MRHEIVLSPGVVRAYRALPAQVRSRVRDGIERHPRHEPKKVSKSRIKNLRGLSRPQFRLRIGEIRVFYDVTDATVEVLDIVPKEQAAGWLAEHGIKESGGSTGEGEG